MINNPLFQNIVQIILAAWNKQIDTLLYVEQIYQKIHICLENVFIQY